MREDDVISRSKSRQNSEPIDFHRKIQFSAGKDITARRSASFLPRVIVKETNIWDLKPPDFNPQAFSSQLPERNSRAAIRPWTYGSPRDAEIAKALKIATANRKQNRRREEELIALVKYASAVHLPPTEAEARPNFRLRFQPTNAFKVKLQSVRQSRFNQEAFEDIKPYDFRQYPRLKQLGLPEFTTNYPKDPMALRFKTQRLDIMSGRDPYLVSNATGTVLRNQPEQPPNWDQRLILPKESYPNKIHSFTRHRRLDRSARSAFLERAENMMIKRSVTVL